MTCPFIDEADNPTLAKLLHVNEVMRVYGRELPAKVLSTFYYIAANPGCYKRELDIHLGLASSTSTNTIDRLVKNNLVQKRHDGYLVYIDLTDDGEKLANRLEMLIG